MLKQHYNKIYSRMSKNGRIAILHHTDVDGICAGVIVAKALERITGKNIDLRLNQGHSEVSLMPETASKIEDAKITDLFIVDLAVDQNPEAIKKAEKDFRIFILDHHNPKVNLNSRKTLCIKTQYISNLEGGKYPSSKLCFDIFEDKIKDLEWIAAIGIYGDGAYLQWKKFVDSQFKDITILQRLCKLITAAETVESIEECFNIISSAASPGDILNSNLVRYQTVLEDELQYWLKNGKVQESKNLIWYEIYPKYPIASPLSTDIGLKNKNKDKVIIIIQDLRQDKLDISARNFSGRFEVNSLIEEAISGLEDSTGGGHAKAAGAIIRRKDLQKFRKNIQRLLG